MARPTRQGVDYFPLDVYLDNKVKFLIIKFGLEGLGAIVTIFQEIYANGYWCKWGEDEKLIFTHENNIEIDKLNNIVDEALKRDIFDIELFEKHGILTSRGIQKRYKEIVSRRKDVEIVTEYLLVENNFGVNTVIEPTECIHDVDMMSAEYMPDDIKSTQSKVNRKESRVKEEKSKEEEAKKPVPYKKLLEIYHNTLPELPKVIKLNDSRRKAIKSRIAEYSLKDIESVFKKTSESDFLTGKSKDWSANFDWIMKSSNFIKILEGNYDNRQGGQDAAGTNKSNGNSKEEGKSLAERAGVISL